MQIKILKIWISVLSVALISLACKVSVGGPDYPSSSVPVSMEAVSNLELQVEAAQTAAAQTGVITLIINETQITSLLAMKLASQPDPFIQNPQVYLRDNEILVYGQATQGNLSANVRIILNANIDQDGKPFIKISSAEFGPFPAPDGLNSSISTFIDQAFTGALGPAATGLRLDTIAIADGIMTLTGHVK